MSMLPNDNSIQIPEVWNDNLESEMALIRGIVDYFPFVAMDTAFPGTVFAPVGAFQTATEYHYETLRTNVNLLKMIQLGLTFSDKNGNLPTCGPDNRYCIWQFNFREFDLSFDNFSHDSIDLLRRSGIDFAKTTETASFRDASPSF
ncbi:hypothetical protein Bca52824_010444 [Brassica carinata]|uniref:poly(A)-specific ribonuclease n=1 Tax=Brassica carinata TaxID=52824 RepID=A0A8X7WDX2_BRACI|nr:hypothetical protein Bca52824_010444 [Brassica carinata]